MYVARISQAERRETADRRLLKAACRIISGYGLSALTCEDVGKLAGYSRGQTYQRFGSKEGLLIAAVERLRAYRRECVKQDAQRGKSGIEELIDYCGLHLGALTKGPEMAAYFGVLSGPVPSKQKLRQAVDAARAEIFEEISLLLAQARRDDTVQDGVDIERDVPMIFGLMSGIALQYRQFRGAGDFRQVRRDAEVFLRNAISPTSKSSSQGRVLELAASVPKPATTQ
jgi:AcrR family transcriptional regulator